MRPPPGRPALQDSIQQQLQQQQCMRHLGAQGRWPAGVRPHAHAPPPQAPAPSATASAQMLSTLQELWASSQHAGAGTAQWPGNSGPFPNSAGVPNGAGVLAAGFVSAQSARQVSQQQVSQQQDASAPQFSAAAAQYSAAAQYGGPGATSAAAVPTGSYQYPRDMQQQHVQVGLQRYLLVTLLLVYR